MLSVHCPRHAADVLLSERRITAAVQEVDGIVLLWRCWCGEEGEVHVTRRPRAERLEARAAAAVREAALAGAPAPTRSSPVADLVGARRRAGRLRGRLA